MLDPTLISVIVPCRNGENTLARCLCSVQQQTYRNFELIFIDDGSADGSVEIAKEFARTDGRFRVYSRKNHGVSASRNFGLRHAKGAFVQFLDADDEMLPEMLERLWTALQDTDADCAVCNYFGNPMFQSFLSDRVYDLTDARQLLEYTQETFGFLVPWNKLFRREALAGLAFDETVHFAEDDLFNLTAVGSLCSVVTLSARLYHYHCAAEEAGSSCIQKLVSDPDFAKKKHSIWYEGAKLLSHRRAIAAATVEKGRISPEEAEDLIYGRMQDFFFWELVSYAVMQVPQSVLIEEAEQVFAEPAFRYSYLLQEKYGLSFRRPTPEKIKGMAGTFVLRCLACFADIRENHGELDPGKIFGMLFLKLFAVDTGREPDTRGSLARLQLQLQRGETAEARYVNALLPVAEFAS